MKILLKQMILTLTAVLLLSSCQKYLDKKSSTSLVVPKSLDELEGLLNDFVLMNQLTPGLGEASADDYFLPAATYNSLDMLHSSVYTWTLGDYNYPNDWANAYTAIYNTNYCLEKLAEIPKTAGNTSQWNFVKGSALFYRSFWLAQIAWVFSLAYDPATAATDLGIPIRVSSDQNIPSVRSSIKQTYERIDMDLREAVNLLPPLPPSHPAQASGAAANGLLARLALFNLQYDSAAVYANRALAIQHKLLDYNDPSVAAPANIPFKAMNQEIVFYSLMTTSYFIKSPSTALTDSTLYSSYETSDLRRTVFFRANGLYRRFKGSYAAHATTLFTGIATDELYLIRAEALSRKGNAVAALADLNLLMVNRYRKGEFTQLRLEGPDLLERILSERRKELLFRGIRWPDIKRLNKTRGNIIPTRLINGQPVRLQVASSRYALPLPKDIINTTGMPQN